MLNMTDAEWLDHYAERKRILDEYDRLQKEADQLFDVWMEGIKAEGGKHDLSKSLQSPQGTAFLRAHEIAKDYYDSVVLQNAKGD